MAIDLIEEKIILKGLVQDKTYFDKVIPYLQPDLFSQRHTRKLFECISGYHAKYGKQATNQVLDMFASTVKKISEDEYNSLETCIDYIKTEEKAPDSKWLIDHTVDWIKNRKYYLAVIEAANQFENGVLDSSLPNKLQDTLGFTIDESIGLDSENNEEKYRLYTSLESKVPFALQGFNNLTQGGVSRGALHMLLSSTTGGGKTLSKCSLAAYYMMAGLNVLYVSLELAEKDIMRRIEGTLTDTPIDVIAKQDESNYLSMMESVQRKYRGRCIAKQFPPGIATANHINRLIEELALKSKFKPDVLMVDYLGLIASSRYNQQGKKYEVLAAAAEELRGTCIQYDLVGWTSQQSNRSGMSEPENLGLESISESLGISYTMDLIVGIVTNEQFQADHKLFFHALKNRYNAPGVNAKFFLGVDYMKMKLYDLSNPIEDTNPTYESAASFGSSYQSQAKKALNRFDGFE